MVIIRLAKVSERHHLRPHCQPHPDTLRAQCTLLVFLPYVSFCHFLVLNHFSCNWCAVRRTVVGVHFTSRLFKKDVAVRTGAPFVNMVDSLTCC